PDEVFGRVSHLLFERTPPEKYATGFLATLEPAGGAFRYCNAGHNPGILLRTAGDVEWLASTGVPLGILPSGVYTTAEVDVAPGDTVVIYTDGLTEAESPDDEEYGEERLAELCARHRGDDLEAMAAAIAADQDAFVRGVPYADDRTIVLIRRV
ncbi:MAG TPA: PP2C family protein-serine/threonine phosphatase, partial [Candidatus Sulfomarinibacteraceae bacterium]|nr:PP2C family protein-serine/threonine phosphatase [Candidatus Sulfomarinibacteraceae bacterium]